MGNFDNFDPKKFVQDQRRKHEEEKSNQVLNQFLKQYPKKLKEKSYSDQLKDYRKEEQEEKSKKDLKILKKLKRVDKSKTGKVGKAVSGVYSLAGNKGALTRKFYGSQIAPKEESNKQVEQLKIKYLKEKLERLRQQEALNQFRQPERLHFDNMFSNFANPHVNVVGQVEREIGSFGKNHSNCGDHEAFKIGNEALFYGRSPNNSIFNPFNQLDREVNSHANLQHINPSFSISKEADIFANIIP